MQQSPSTRTDRLLTGLPEGMTRDTSTQLMSRGLADQGLLGKMFLGRIAPYVLEQIGDRALSHSEGGLD